MPVSEKERLALYQQLTESFGPPHAETLMESLPPMSWEQLATKDDLKLTAKELRGEMAELRGEMAEMKAELKGDIAELRGEMAEMKAELKSELAELRGEMQAGFAAIEFRFAQQTRTMMWALTGFALTVWISLLVTNIG